MQMEIVELLSVIFFVGLLVIVWFLGLAKIKKEIDNLCKQASDAADHLAYVNVHFKNFKKAMDLDKQPGQPEKQFVTLEVEKQTFGKPPRNPQMPLKESKPKRIRRRYSKSRKYRTIIRDKIREGWGIKQIAEFMGVRENVVRYHLKRIRKWDAK